MKNFEKFEDQIKEMYRNCDGFGIKNGKLINCETNADCILCDFFNREKCVCQGCSYERIKWLYSEYKEPIVLTPFEHELLKRLKKIGCKYIARDEDGELDAYQSKIEKNRCCWESEYSGAYSIDNWLDCFHFMKWEDAEPYSVDDLLKCEVQS